MITHVGSRIRSTLYRIRKLLLSGSGRLSERGTDRLLLGLRVGDPDDEALGSGPVNRQESVRDVDLTDNYKDTAILLDKAIAGCATDQVEEICSLGKTLTS